MPTFTIERRYLVPVYQHVTIEADTPEEAMAKALELDDWSNSRTDDENAGPTFITEAWEGETPYGAVAIDIPSCYGEHAVMKSARGEEPPER